MGNITEEDFYRGICETCGIFIDSAYCDKVLGGYKCYGCGMTHKVNHGKKYFIRLVHTSGRIKTGRMTLRSSMSQFIKMIGEHGWFASDCAELTIDPDTGRYYSLQKVTVGGANHG